jgi:hypothetical protein
LLIFFLKFLIRLLVFPGSFSFWRKNVENNYAKAFAKRALIRIQEAINLIDAIAY